MVCLCCKVVVADLLNKTNVLFSSIELGEVQLVKSISIEQTNEIRNQLNQYGLELIEDKNAILVENIVNIIINMIYKSEELPPENFSVFLSNKLNLTYHSLSSLFSVTKGVTIEHFIILHKIERAKDLIMSDELSLTEISYKLQYSSVAHLSNQFKKITGLTPTYYKKIKNKKRLPIESL